MITSACACPTRSPLQAVTMTRPVPLKAGIGKVTRGDGRQHAIAEAERRRSNEDHFAPPRSSPHKF